MNFRTFIINYIMKIGNSIISQCDGGLNRPVFLDVNKTFPKLSLIEQTLMLLKPNLKM